eukprot:3385429-Prymnesium_polylepis.1
MGKPIQRQRIQLAVGSNTVGLSNRAQYCAQTGDGHECSVVACGGHGMKLMCRSRVRPELTRCVCCRHATKQHVALQPCRMYSSRTPFTSQRPRSKERRSAGSCELQITTLAIDEVPEERPARCNPCPLDGGRPFGVRPCSAAQLLSI